MFKIAVCPGDGIGPEVIRQALKIVRRVGEVFHLVFEVEECLIGGSSIDQTGKPICSETEKIVQNSDAVLLGAVGGTQWDHLDIALRPERGLLAIRKLLHVYSNLRPVRIFPSLTANSPLREEIIRNVNLVIVRELISGIYFGEPKGIENLPGGQRRGFSTMSYTTEEVERIARQAFDLARRRKKKVTSVDKANVLDVSRLWRETVNQVHQSYSDIQLEHRYIDECAMRLVKSPSEFDVVLTGNMFGDILSDEAAILAGSLGMLPSASLGESIALYEPVHGSAPDIAGEDKANPIAAILCVAMMLENSFNLTDLSLVVERAVEDTLNDGYRTADIHQVGSDLVGCDKMGDLIASKIHQ